MLWRNGLTAIPLVMAVAVIGRVFPCRPATRHALWLTVLLSLVVPPMLPGFDSVAPLPPLANPTFTLSDVSRPSDSIQADGSKGAIVQRVGQRSEPETSTSESASPMPTTESRRKARAAERASSPSLPKRRQTRSDVKPDNPVLLLGIAPDPATPSIEGNGPAPTLRRSARRADLPRSPDETQSQTPNERAAASMDRQSFLNPPSDRIAETPGPSAWAVASARWLLAVITVRDAVFALPPIPKPIWIGGALLLAAIGVLRTWAAWRRIQAVRPAPPTVTNLVGRLSTFAGLRRPPKTFMTDRAVSPFLWCGRQACLVVPTGLWSQLDEVGREAVILHELAHLKRKDHWVCWAEVLIGCLYWWHPLVWWARSRLQAEADACCDAWVTWLLPRGRRAYAEALLKTKHFLSADSVPMPAVGMGVLTGRAGQFARRLKMVMTQTNKPGLSVSGIGLACLLAMVGWLASPAQSCEPEVKKAFVKAAGCGQPCAPCAHCKKGNCSDDCKKAREKEKVKAKAWGAGYAELAAAPAPPVAPAAPIAPCPPCPPCPPTPAPAALAPEAPELSTFHAHLLGKKGLLPSVVYAKPRSPQPGTPVETTQPVVTARPRRPGPGGEDLEHRMARLEEQLNRLGEQLGRLGEAVGEGQGRGEGRAAAREARDAAREARNAERIARQIERQKEKSSEGSDGIVVRTYKLSGGKLEDFTKLMVRSDVPIRVRPVDDGLEVHATKKQHKTIAAFLEAIAADGERSDAAELDDEEALAGLFDDEDADDEDADEEEAEEDDDDDDDEDEDREADWPTLYGQWWNVPAQQITEALAQWKHVESQGMTDDVKRAVELALAQSGSQFGDAAGQMVQMLEQQARHFEEQARQLDGQMRAHEERIRATERHADELDRNAEQIENGAEDAHEQAKAEAHRAARGIYKQAQIVRREAEIVQRQTEKLTEYGDRLRESADALREAARALQKSKAEQ